MSEAEDRWVRLSDVPSIADERWLHMPNGFVEPQVFAGLSHAEVLALEFPPERMLIEDLIPIGAVGTIAGVPETYKSWQAQAIAIAVASGSGGIFEREVVHSGPVGYFWQDDSTREEAERIKLYDQVHGDGSDLPLRWFLNEGLRLPEHMQRLKETIDHYAFELVVLDSFYNVLFGLNLKDEVSEQVVALLKSEISDATGCTVLIVDHMPWATDVNRSRLRSYGGVFKGAATRFGIYLDAVGQKLWVEARGNNIKGFKRTLAEWDAEALEIKLITNAEQIDEAEYQQRILDHLAEHPNETTAGLNEIKGTRAKVLAARTQLLNSGQIVRFQNRTIGAGYRWNLSNHAGLSSTIEEGSESSLFASESYDQPNVLLDSDAPQNEYQSGSEQYDPENVLPRTTESYDRTDSTPLKGRLLDRTTTRTPAEDDIPF